MKEQNLSRTGRTPHHTCCPDRILFLSLRESCTSLGLWRGLVIAAYGDGHLRVFDMETGRMFVEVAAHARWINALDIAKNGMVTETFVQNQAA